MAERPSAERLAEIRKGLARGELDSSWKAARDLLAEIDALKAELEEAQENAISDPMMLIEELREDLRDVAKHRDAIMATMRCKCGEELLRQCPVCDVEAR